VNRKSIGFDIRTALILLCSLVVWLSAWEIFVRGGVLMSSVLPAPDSVIATMFSSSFYRNTGRTAILATFSWTLLAWLSGTGLGLLLVAAALRLKFVTQSLAFVFLAGRSLPSVVAIPIFAAALGIGRSTGFLCAVFLCVCYSVPTLEESMSSTAASKRVLREALGLGGWQALWLVTMPGIGRAVRAIGVQSFGIALVVTVAGEMILSLENTVGDQVAKLAWLVRMVEVYALVGWLVICSMGLNVATYVLPHLFTYPAKRMALSMESKLESREG
jgi:ABC-type nitrate/sulfonate/bicarbonate transport system permease component